MDINIEKAYNLLISKLEGWWETLILMLPNLIVAILVLIAFIILARIGNKVTYKIISRITTRTALINFFPKVIFFVVVVIGIFLSLSILKLDKAVTSLLAGAGIAGLALSLAFQSTATNFMAGIFLIIKKPIQVGHVIKVDNVMGTVHKMNLRNTIIHSFQGQKIYIPNKNISQNIFYNYSALGKRRVDIEVGVSYSDDLLKTQEIALKTLNKLPFIKQNEDISAFYEEFGNSSIHFRLIFWIDYPDEPSFLKAKSEAIIAIKKAFDENNITIPFPIRTLDFEINNRKELSSLIEGKNET